MSCFICEIVMSAAMPTSEKPKALPVQADQIPLVLRGLNQWLYWKYQPKQNGDWTKPPYSAHSRSKADVTKPVNYASFDEAIDVYKRGHADGVGLALISDGALTFVDLDHCRDEDTGEIDAWAVGYIRRFPQSYVEISPSRTGLHIILKGTIPRAKGIKRPVTADGAHPKAAIEVYSSGRYATITGNVIDDGHTEPGDAQAEILALYTELSPPVESPSNPPPSLHLVSREPVHITDRLNVARRAVNGSAFVALYDDGNLSDYHGDHSAADLGLCSRLGFYLDYQPALIDEAFRASALMRPKWDKSHRHDGSTYGQMTIEKVLSTRGDSYAPIQHVTGKALPIVERNNTDSDDAYEHDNTDEHDANDASKRPIIDRFMTAKELCAMVPSEPEWIAQPFLVAGGITELDGAPKAGKSTLLGYMVRRIAEGGDFLGFETVSGPVVYLTEQSPGTFREILARSNLTTCENVYVLSWHDVRLDQWPAVVESAYHKCLQVGASTLVVDTLPQFAGLRGDSENNAGDALTAIEPVQAVAGRGIAVIIVRHDRKSGGDVGASARGSSAFGGAVDIIMQIGKADGAARPTLRTLKALSRFDETPAEITIERQDDGTFTALEPRQAFQVNRAKSQILDLLPRIESQAMSVEEIMDDLGDVKRNTVMKALKTLMEDGIAQRSGAGTRGNPHLYWVANEPESVDEMVSVAATETPQQKQKRLPVVSVAGTPPRRGVPENRNLTAAESTPKVSVADDLEDILDDDD